jgi:hypothetical protein
MRMVIRWLSGAIHAGMLIAFKDDALRIAMAGFEDIVELRWRNFGWVDNSGASVTIDFEPSAEAFESARGLHNHPHPLDGVPSATNGVATHPAPGRVPQYIN